jgi:hypothetical protein
MVDRYIHIYVNKKSKTGGLVSGELKAHSVGLKTPYESMRFNMEARNLFM